MPASCAAASDPKLRQAALTQTPCRLGPHPGPHPLALPPLPPGPPGWRGPPPGCRRRRHSRRRLHRSCPAPPWTGSSCPLPAPRTGPVVGGGGVVEWLEGLGGERRRLGQHHSIQDLGHIKQLSEATSACLGQGLYVGGMGRQHVAMVCRQLHHSNSDVHHVCSRHLYCDTPHEATTVQGRLGPSRRHQRACTSLIWLGLPARR
jgi:hypothetical protein